MQSDEALSISQLHRKARNGLAREFRGYAWVRGEIKSLRQHRGSLYINVVEPGEWADGGDVFLDVSCWPKKRLVLEKQLADLGIALVAGMEIRFRGTVTLSKLGKLQVELAELDVEALLGRQEGEKRRLLAALDREGLTKRNATIALTAVPLRIGLVTSEGSDGHRDFAGRIESSAYAFEIILSHAAVQGPAAPASLARSIEWLQSQQLDLIAVVRGGGGELDAFDKEPVARAICNSKYPVWTGLGHTSDHSVADEVAQRNLITPTACAHAIVAHVDEFADRFGQAIERISRSVDARLQRESTHIEHMRRHAGTAANGAVDRASMRMKASSTRLHDRTLSRLKLSADSAINTRRRLVESVSRNLETAKSSVDNKRSVVRLLDPQRPLRLGYSITRDSSGNIVRSVTGLDCGAELVTCVEDGSLTSVVETITPVASNKDDQ